MAESSDRGYASQDDGRQRDSISRGAGNGSEENEDRNSRGGKSNRGFASMSPERQREIASKGGRAAHEKGTAHEWTPDEARRAGRKGGETVSRDRAHMAAIGREGGGARSARRNTPPSGNQAVSENGEERGGRGARENGRGDEDRAERSR
jgi:general stress protein YciG